FASPMETFAQTTTWNPDVQLLNTAKNVIFILLPAAQIQTAALDLRVGSWTPKDFAPTTINGIDWPAGLLPNLATQWRLGCFSIMRSAQSTSLFHPLLQNWAQIARNPTSATGKIAPNIGTIAAFELEKQRLPNQ